MYIGHDSRRVLVSLGVQLAKDKRSPSNKKLPKKTAATRRAGLAQHDENRAPPPHSNDIEDFVSYYNERFPLRGTTPPWRPVSTTPSGWDSDSSAELDSCTFRGVGKSLRQVHQNVSTGPLQAQVHHPPATASHPGAPPGQAHPPVRVLHNFAFFESPPLVRRMPHAFVGKGDTREKRS